MSHRTLATLSLLTTLLACTTEPEVSTTDEEVVNCTDGSMPVTCYDDLDHDGQGAGIGIAKCGCGSVGTSTSNTDCNDHDGTVRRRTCYEDADGDGVAGSALPAACTTACSNRGQVEASVDLVLDCDDTDRDAYQMLSCYSDSDGDHFGSKSSGKTSVCAGLTCADGVAHEAESAGDCNDSDASVHPFREEVPGNGTDEDCTGAADEARAQFYSSGNGSTSSAFAIKVQLENTDEIASATAGTLRAKIYYRKLENGSAAYSSTAIVPATVTTFFGKTYASVTLSGLAALTVYEVRLDLYKSTTTRIQPLSCTGTSASATPCSNSDVYYAMTKPATGNFPAQLGRWSIVTNALAEYFYFRTHALGSWDTSLRDHYDLKERNTAYCSEFYATSARPFLVDMNPCQASSSRPWCDSTQTSDDESSVAAVRRWFDDYNAVDDSVTEADLIAAKPGDYLGVNPNSEFTCGQHSQMFLAYDQGAKLIWVVEGNGSTTLPPWGDVSHVSNVKAFPLEESSGDSWVKTLGSVDDAAMLDP